MREGLRPRDVLVLGALIGGLAALVHLLVFWVSPMIFCPGPLCVWRS